MVTDSREDLPWRSFVGIVLGVPIKLRQQKELNMPLRYPC